MSEPSLTRIAESESDGDRRSTAPDSAASTPLPGATNRLANSFSSMFGPTDALKQKFSDLRKRMGLQKPEAPVEKDEGPAASASNPFASCQPPVTSDNTLAPGWGYIVGCPLRPEEYEAVRQCAYGDGRSSIPCLMLGVARARRRCTCPQDRQSHTQRFEGISCRPRRSGVLCGLPQEAQGEIRAKRGFDVTTIMLLQTLHYLKFWLKVEHFRSTARTSDGATLGGLGNHLMHGIYRHCAEGGGQHSHRIRATRLAAPHQAQRRHCATTQCHSILRHHCSALHVL